jgi:hypothetical protein
MTVPSFQNFLTIATGWTFANRRTVTGMLLAADVAGKQHHAAFHRFFAEARWSLDDLGLAVFRLFERFCGDGVFVIIDDTLVHKRGLKMFGTGMHHDPLVSSRKHVVVNWGHCWVVLGVMIRCPLWPQRPFCAGGLGAALAWLLGRRRIAILTLAAAFAIFNYIAVLVVYPDLERFKPIPAVAAAFSDRAGPSATLAHYRRSLPSLVYYADHRVAEIPTLDAAVEQLSADPTTDEVWIIMGEGDARDVQSRVPSACVALRHPIFDLQPAQVLDSAPPPSVVLLTNRCR